MRILAAIVRLAEGLDRSHGQVVKTIVIDRRPDALVVRLRGAADPELELWAAGRHATPLAELLGTEIRFEAVPSAKRSAAPPGRGVQRHSIAAPTSPGARTGRIG